MTRRWARTRLTASCWRTPSSSRPKRRRGSCCRTPTRPAISRRPWRHAWIGRSSPTAWGRSARTERSCSCDRCFKGSSWPTSCPEGTRRISRAFRSVPTGPTRWREATRRHPSARRPSPSTRPPFASAPRLPSKKPSRRSISARPHGLSRSGVGSRAKSIWRWRKSWRRRSTPSWPPPARFAMRGGYPWIGRLAALARRWRRSCIWRWASLAPSSIWSE